jgi:hypothetical protein
MFAWSRVAREEKVRMGRKQTRLGRVLSGCRHVLPGLLGPVLAIGAILLIGGKSDAEPRKEHEVCSLSPSPIKVATSSASP